MRALLGNKIALASLVAAVLWIIAMIWMPFQSVYGTGVNNLDVMDNPTMYVILVLIFGGVTCLDCVARSGSSVLWSGILMAIWTVRSIVQTVNNHWDLSFGAVLSIICCVVVIACGAYQMFLNKRS